MLYLDLMFWYVVAGVWKVKWLFVDGYDLRCAACRSRLSFVFRRARWTLIVAATCHRSLYRKRMSTIWRSMFKPIAGNLADWKVWGQKGTVQTNVVNVALEKAKETTLPLL